MEPLDLRGASGFNPARSQWTVFTLSFTKMIEDIIGGVYVYFDDDFGCWN